MSSVLQTQITAEFSNNDVKPAKKKHYTCTVTIHRPKPVVIKGEYGNITVAMKSNGLLVVARKLTTKEQKKVCRKMVNGGVLGMLFHPNTARLLIPALQQFIDASAWKVSVSQPKLKATKKAGRK